MPELHARLSHSAHVASSSSAAQPGRSAGSSVARSLGQLHSNLLPVLQQPYVNIVFVCECIMFIFKSVCSTNLDVVMSLHQGFSDLAS